MTENQIRKAVLKVLESKIRQQLNVFTDQQRIEETTPTKPIVRLPDGTEMPADTYVKTQIQQEMAKINSKWDQVRQVARHDAEQKAPDFWGQSCSFKKEYPIRFGRDWTGRADLVLLLDNKPIVIVECKALGLIGRGKIQLEAYLNASGTNLGVFANHPDPQKWRYYDNSIRFDEIDRSTFWEKIEAVFNTERDIEKEAQEQKQQRIEERAKELVEERAKKIVDATPEVIQECANKMIDEEVKKRVTQNAIHRAVEQRLQQEKKQLEVQLQNKTDQLKSKINNLQTALDERRNSAMWGWILFGISVFGISVVLLIAVATNS